MARLDKNQHERARHLLDALWAEVEVIELDELLAVTAAEAAHALGLRGYDAVHCAAAEQLADDDLVAASGDRRLLKAWSERGLSTYDTNA